MTRRRVAVSVLMALGLALQLVEAMVALPVFLPGARLGLANVATLVVLAEFGPASAALFGLVRHVLGSLITGTFLVPTFWLGMGGSLAVALLLLAVGHRVGLRALGVLAGATFQVGQGVALVGLAGSTTVAAYLPPLLALGVGAGWGTGLLAERTARVLQPARAWPPDRSLPVAAVLLATALALAFALMPGRTEAGATRAHVLVAGHEVMTLALDHSERRSLAVAGGHMLIETAPGRIRVLQSDCPDRVCVLTGWVSAAGRTVFCAPYRVLITLEGGPPGVDGVV